MNRLNPETIVSAVRAAGFKFIRGTWWNENCGCGLGAYAATKGPGPLDYSSEICARLGISVNYLDGFVIGFDGGKLPDHFKHPENLTGHEDGEATAKLVTKEKMWR